MNKVTPLLPYAESDSQAVDFEPCKINMTPEKVSPEMDFDKLKKTMIPIMVALTISTVLYTYLQAFYPLYMDLKFPDLTSVHFSIILATFEIAQLTTCLVLGKFMPTKRKSWIIYAFLLELFATLSFSLFVYLENDQSQFFFIASIVLRGLQGLGAAIIMSCTYSFIINELAPEKDAYIGYAEMTMGLGDIVGPAMGGFMYAYFGYVGTFLSFSAFIYIGIIVALILIPKSLNKRIAPVYIEESFSDESLLSDEQTDSTLKSKQTLTYLKIVSHYECTIIILAMVFAVTFCLYNESILALALQNKFLLSQELIGLCFMMSSLSYLLGSYLIGYLSQHMHRRYIMWIGFTLMIGQNILLGPSQMLGLEPKVMYVFMGMFMMGLNMAIAMVPAMSETIEILLNTKLYDVDAVNDLSVGAINATYSFGNLVAPITGGVLSYYYGYDQTCDIMVIACLAFSVFFYFTMIFRKDLKI